MIISDTMRIITVDEKGKHLTEGITMGPPENVVESIKHGNGLDYNVPRVVQAYGKLQHRTYVGDVYTDWEDVEVVHSNG